MIVEKENNTEFYHMLLQLLLIFFRFWIVWVRAQQNWNKKKQAVLHLHEVQPVFYIVIKDMKTALCCLHLITAGRFSFYNICQS